MRASRVGSGGKHPLPAGWRYILSPELFRHTMRYLTRTRLILPLLAIAALAAPAAATAKGGDDVIRDCAQDGDLDGNYSQDELDEAYNNMPSDIDEYSNCREVIERARERESGGAENGAGSAPGALAPSGDSSSGGGGAAPGGSGDDSAELDARGDRSRNGEAPEAHIAGQELSGSDGTLGTDDESDGMPAPLIAALLLAALAAIAGALYLLRDRLPPGIASRLPGPLKPNSQD